MPKILIVTLKFPFPMTGACEIDCATGILQFQRLGWGVKVITKVANYQTPESVEEMSRELGIEMMPVSVKFNPAASPVKKFKGYLKRFLTNPLILDGAAFEYNDREMKEVLEEKIVNWRPDLVWFDCTQMWPLYSIVKKHKVPIVVRSQNFEPAHFLEENGRSFLNLIRFVPKLIGELIAIRRADLVLPLSVKEAGLYKKLGSRRVVLFPIRGLTACFQGERLVKDKEQLNVFYMGSTYNVFHMRNDLEFILKDVAPEAARRAPGKFVFHIFGKKFPDEFRKYLRENVICRGYVEDLPKALDDMDIALIPALHGAGQKKKVFEPLVRGFPTITSPKGLAGYPFRDREEVLLARNKKEFISQLMRMQDFGLRKKISQNVFKKSKDLFSQEKFDSIICAELTALISKTSS